MAELHVASEEAKAGDEKAEERWQTAFKHGEQQLHELATLLQQQ